MVTLNIKKKTTDMITMKSTTVLFISLFIIIEFRSMMILIHNRREKSMKTMIDLRIEEMTFNMKNELVDVKIRSRFNNSRRREKKETMTLSIGLMRSKNMMLTIMLRRKLNKRITNIRHRNNKELLSKVMLVRKNKREEIEFYLYIFNFLNSVEILQNNFF